MKKIKGWAVLGQWGITMVSTDLMFHEKIFKKEIKRLTKLGFSASVVPCEIKLLSPKKLIR